MEINNDREWVIVNNLHRRSSYLLFWGELTADNTARSYCGYGSDYEKCERYSTKDKEEHYQNDFPTYDSKTHRYVLSSVDNYWIKLSELLKVFTPQKVIAAI